MPSPAAAPQTAPAPDQEAAPAPDQKAAPAPDQMPADEAPAVSPAPAPNESVDDPATSLFDEALARISLSMAARRLELPSGPTSEPEQGTESLSDRGVSTLAGAAVLAVGGYRVLLGRSDRIKRRAGRPAGSCEPWAGLVRSRMGRANAIDRAGSAGKLGPIAATDLEGGSVAASLLMSIGHVSSSLLRLPEPRRLCTLDHVGWLAVPR